MDLWILQDGFWRIWTDFGWIWEGFPWIRRFCSVLHFLVGRGRISMVLWILKILVGPGNDFHGSVHFGGFQKSYGFWLDLARISMDLWILEEILSF